MSSIRMILYALTVDRQLKQFLVPQKCRVCMDRFNRVRYTINLDDYKMN